MLDLSDRGELEGRAAAELGVRALPSLVFLDAMGEVRRRVPGVAQPEVIIAAAKTAQL